MPFQKEDCMYVLQLYFYLLISCPPRQVKMQKNNILVKKIRLKNY